MPPHQPPLRSPRPTKRAFGHIEWNASSVRSDTLAARESTPDTPIELVGAKAHQEVDRVTPVAPMPAYRAGELLAGKYRLVQPLGHGMSSVWVAENLLLGGNCALKLIHDGGDPHAGARMLREVQAAARVEHPAIIRMLDFGVTDRGDPFLVMDLLSGVSVRDRLKRQGPLSPVDAVRLLLPIADGLVVAHAHGIVHGDIKPDNIICVPVGAARFQPKLIDFGIARQVGERPITENGMVLGSPEYLSPEQAQGLPDVDEKTDIWSFSITLYEMATGTTPFFSDGVPALVLDAILERPPPAIAEFGIQDAELWSIISRGLQKSPGSRWSDMRAFGMALAKWLLRQGIEDDIGLRPLRESWLREDGSLPPVAMDAQRAEDAKVAALAEEYDVPKKSFFRTALGVAAALLTVALLCVAGFSTRSALRPAAGRAPGPPPMLQPAAAPQPPMGAFVTPVRPAVVLPPSASTTPVATPKPSDQKLAALAPGATRAPKARERLVPPAQGARPATPLEPRVTEETTLPEVKLPPDFGGSPPVSPNAGGAPNGKASIDTETVTKMDNPYVDDGQ
jgi:serine/threonine protein kinase